MFSIILPVFNKEKYINNTVNSILNQTFKDFELIIIDDGSTDKSIEIIQSIIDRRIKVFTQKNSGVSIARNKGISLAEKEYIAFIDADDFWDSRFLETINELIMFYPSAGAFFSDYQLVENIKETVILKKEIKASKKLLIKNYFKYVIENNKAMWTSCVIVKKKVLNDMGGFPEKISRGEDVHLWTSIALYYDIAYTSYIGAYYNRGVEDSLTRGDFELEKSFANTAEEFLNKNIELVDDQKSFYEYMMTYVLSKAKYKIKNCRNREARKILKKYRNTDNKKLLLVLYILSYLPNVFVKRLL